MEDAEDAVVKILNIKFLMALIKMLEKLRTYILDATKNYAQDQIISY